MMQLTQGRGSGGSRQKLAANEPQTEFRWCAQAASLSWERVLHSRRLLPLKQTPPCPWRRDGVRQLHGRDPTSLQRGGLGE